MTQPLHLGIYPGDLKTYVHPKALFTVSKDGKKSNVHNSIIHSKQRWKKVKCAANHELINNMWYIYTMGCYLVMKKNSISTHPNGGKP